MTADRPLGCRTTKEKLVLLGTKGGPRPSLSRSNPANLICSPGRNYLIDCGYGVTRQLLAAGVQPHEVDTILITHHHSDHTLELGPFLYNAWVVGRRTQVDIWGPPPLRLLVDGFFRANLFEIETRMSDEGRFDPRPLFRVHEFEQPRVLIEGDGIKITAGTVRHPPLRHAFAYRFDLQDRSFVLSGDTAACPDLIELAKGADVLVHEVMHLDSLPKLVAGLPNAPHLRAHLIASHTTTGDVGKIATRAEVGMLVLNHLVPGDDASITDEVWLAEPRAEFMGPVLLGCDLMVI
jgi:ribonuclease BN (tRNA processing enzyme)